MPPINVRFKEPKESKCWKLSVQALFNFLVLRDASRVSGTAEEEEEEEALQTHPKKLCTLQTP